MQVAKNRHLGTIAQLCPSMFSQLRHVSTIEFSVTVKHIATVADLLQLLEAFDEVNVVAVVRLVVVQFSQRVVHRALCLQFCTHITRLNY